MADPDFGSKLEVAAGAAAQEDNELYPTQTSAKRLTTAGIPHEPVLLNSESFHFIRSALLRSPLLSSLTNIDNADPDHNAALDLLVQSCRRVQLPAAELLVKQDETGDEFYVIEKGDVEVIKTRHRSKDEHARSHSPWLDRHKRRLLWDDQREEQEYEADTESTEEVVTTRHRGDIIGELSVFYAIPRQASLRTRTPLTAYAIDRQAFQSFLASQPRLSAALQHRRWLRNTLQSHYLFAHMDDEAAKEQLISSFIPHYVPYQTDIIRQGDDADEFYILQDGECAVTTIHSETHQPVQVDTIHPAQSFGDIALLYATQRSATITCQSDEGCVVWSIDGKKFLSSCQKASLFLQHVFYRFATQTDEDTGDKVMNKEQFIHAIKFIKKYQHTNDLPQTKLSTLSDARLRLMFRLADVSGDSVISFAEFLNLHILLTHTHNSAELAFKMFDKNCNGVIEFDEFVRVCQWLAADRGHPPESLDLSHNKFVLDLFRDNDGQLSFQAFQQLLRQDAFPEFLSGIKHDLQAIDAFGAQLDTSLPLSTALLADTTSLISLPPGLQTLDQLDDHLFRLPWKNLIAGGIAGGVSRTLVSPLERLKILFQTQGGDMTVKYTGIRQGLSQMYADDGIRGMFRGNGSNVIRIVPAVALQFFFYDIFKRLMFNSPFFVYTRHDEQQLQTVSELKPLQRLIAGASAGIMACLITYPLDFVRARLTLQSGPNALYGGIIDAFKQVYRQEGIKGFYHGLWPSVVGIAPYMGLDFAVYETLRRYAPTCPGDERRPQKSGLFVCGAIAGTVGQMFAYPLDLIRRRMQVQGFGPANYHYGRSISATMKTIVQQEGVFGLYKGMAANLAKVAPAVSISFVSYEYVREWMGLDTAL